MLFQLKMMLEKEDIYALANAVAQNTAISRGWSVGKKVRRKLIYFVMGGALILMGCFVIALPLILGDRQPYFLAPGIFLLVWGLLAILFGISLNIDGWLTWRRYSPKNTEIQIEFCEDYFASYFPTGESRTSYTVIQKLFEDQMRYFLFVNKNAAVIIRKDSFTVGDPTEFGAWIAEKTEEEITKLR